MHIVCSYVRVNSFSLTLLLYVGRLLSCDFLLSRLLHSSPVKVELSTVPLVAGPVLSMYSDRGYRHVLSREVVQMPAHDCVLIVISATVAAFFMIQKCRMVKVECVSSSLPP